MEYSKNRIYPNSVPEFRMFQKNDGAIEMQVRYINAQMNYISKWQSISVEKENVDRSQNQA